MIRVKNLEESIKFYTEVLNMKVISHEDFPEGQFTLVFLSYGNSKSDPCIELTYNYGKTDYVIGDQWGHMAFGTSNIYETCERVKKMGAKVVREPGPMKHGTTVIAFVEDPNGYKIEFIETK
jgi:lactoylglutathione lyase